MHCPKCGKPYKCPCKTCKGEGWEWNDQDIIKCLTCGLEETCDWWFQLELDIYKKEMSESSPPPIKTKLK